MTVELANVLGGSVSVRVDGKEVALLPPKSDCDLCALQEAFDAVEEKFTEDYENMKEQLLSQIQSW